MYVDIVRFAASRFPNKISNGNSIVFIGYRGEERHITIHMLPDPVFCDMD